MLKQTNIPQKGSGGFLRPEEVLRDNIEIRQGMVIADLGCGSGYFTIPLARAVSNQGKVYAVDVLPGALASVRSRAKLEGLFNVESIRANAEIKGGTNLEDNSVDLVMLSNILFQSDKKNDIIKEASRILKSGGNLIVVEWSEKNPIGPPSSQRVKESEIKEIIMEQNLKLLKSFDAGSYHYGLVFVKP